MHLTIYPFLGIVAGVLISCAGFSIRWKDTFVEFIQRVLGCLGIAAILMAIAYPIANWIANTF